MFIVKNNTIEQMLTEDEVKKYILNIVPVTQERSIKMIESLKNGHIKQIGNGIDFIRFIG